MTGTFLIDDILGSLRFARPLAAVPERSEVLRNLHDAGRIDIVGGIDDIATGEVEFLSAS